MNSSPPKRRWRHFLIDKRFQFTFSLPLVFIAALLFIGLGHLTMNKVESATKIGLNQIEISGSLPVHNAEQLRDILIQRQQLIMYALIAVGIILCIGLLVFGIWITHRVAGPMYRIQVVLKQIERGEYRTVPNIRKSDYLMAFFERFREACSKLRHKEEQDIALFREFIKQLEQDKTICDTDAYQAFIDRLRSKEESLGS